MNKQQAMSYLQRTFPGFQDASVNSALLCADTPAHLPDVYDFALFVTGLGNQCDEDQLHCAFDLIESLLVEGSPDVRDWAYKTIEAMQDIAAWRRQGSARLVPFLGRESRALWNCLEAIRSASSELDLSDCSVFEAEILTWRFVREKFRAQSVAA